MKLDIQTQVSLSHHTTLAVGGPAARFVRVSDEGSLRQALAISRHHGWRTFILGGGSNLLVSDAGFDGLVIQLFGGHIHVDDSDTECAFVRADAGVVWDDLVAFAVSRGLAGVTCLSGIPGSVGAAPIQNIGAYGQEISQTLVALRAVERATGRVHRFTAQDCGFSYRWSRFKGPWRDRFAITEVTFALRKEDRAALNYRDLKRRFPDQSHAPLREARDAVLAIRRDKSMVYDPEDPNHRSAGSFFVNPVVTPAQADAAERAAQQRHGPDTALPRYPAPGGMVKLPAAWLIERAGFTRGHIHGHAGLSSRHCLALINRGHAQTSDLLALAQHIQRRVHDIFGVRLTQEPVTLGFN